MNKEIKLWLTTLFIKWTIQVCPNNDFKVNFLAFLKTNINLLNKQD